MVTLISTDYKIFLYHSTKLLLGEQRPDKRSIEYQIIFYYVSIFKYGKRTNFITATWLTREMFQGAQCRATSIHQSSVDENSRQR